MLVLVLRQQAIVFCITFTVTFYIFLFSNIKYIALKCTQPTFALLYLWLTDLGLTLLVRLIKNKI